jgi:trehalose 6-phosphate synthase
LGRLVVVSNRVAVPSRHGANRAGGLAVAIRPVLKRHPGIWFGWSGRVAAASDLTVRTSQHGHQAYVLIDLAEEDYQEYYNGYANRVVTVHLPWVRQVPGGSLAVRFSGHTRRFL